jgi:hypothetical protein
MLDAAISNAYSFWLGKEVGVARERDGEAGMALRCWW